MTTSPIQHGTDHGSWFSGRVALVTGAGSGMGRAIAVALGQAGACVGVHYRGNQAGAELTTQQVIDAGGRAAVLQADLSNARQVEAMFEELDGEFEPSIEMLVNNAGDWMDKAPILDCPLEQWEKMFAVNALSVFLCCQQAGRRMVEAGKGGVIVNIGSLAGHTGGGGGTVPYAAAKAAVHTLTRGLARELAPMNIRVNCIAPGMIDTPMLEGRISAEAHDTLMTMTPMGRMGLPEEIARSILTLLSPSTSFITGQIIDVNGGLLMR